MTESKKIEIPQSKTKLTKLLLFSILFLIGGLWITIANPQTDNLIFNNPVIKAIGGYGGTIMGVLGVYFFTKKLFDKKPGLILSDKGIYDNTTAFNFGLIPWTDISGIIDRTVKVSTFSKQHFVTIMLNDPDKYISQATNPLKRKLLKANSKNSGSPIHISANVLKTNHNDLLKLACEYFDKYKRTT